MNKTAQAIVDNSAKESLKDSELETDQLNLKKLKEEEIRMKLDDFARELSQLKALRGKH